MSNCEEMPIATLGTLLLLFPYLPQKLVGLLDL
jgi:hypothetical protein